MECQLFALAATVNWKLFKYPLHTPVHVPKVSVSDLHTLVIGKSSFQPQMDNFRHPVLTPFELHDGCRMGIDTWDDTSCAGRHAHIVELVEGSLFTATGFTSSLGKM